MRRGRGRWTLGIVLRDSKTEMLSDEELQRTGPHRINSDRVAAKREPQRQLQWERDP